MQLLARDVENFRRNLRRICDEYGSVQKLADAAGIHRVHLSRIISGRRTPGLDTAIAIAKALEVPLDALLDKPKKSSPLAKIPA